MVCFFEIKLDMTQITRYWDYWYPTYTCIDMKQKRKINHLINAMN